MYTYVYRERERERERQIDIAERAGIFVKRGLRQTGLSRLDPEQLFERPADTSQLLFICLNIFMQLQVAVVSISIARHMFGLLPCK